MKATRITVIIVLTLLITLVIPASATAQAMHIDWQSVDCIVYMGPPEKYWESDGLIHMRGVQVIDTITSDSAYENGTIMMMMNIDLNPATGEGHFYGKYVLTPDAYTGTWEGTISTHLSPSGLRGHGVGKGTGELAGMININWISSDDPTDPCSISTGYVLIP